MALNLFAAHVAQAPIMAFHVPEQFRVRKGDFASDASFGNNGAFFIPNRASRPRGMSTREHGAMPLKVIASDGEGWEHVSVSLPTRCPTWGEMAYVKSVCWDDTDCVVQFHPPRSKYVNNHPFCLHLWRPTDADIATPPSILVGFLVDEQGAK
jgi:hypothetical protein